MLTLLQFFKSLLIPSFALGFKLWFLDYFGYLPLLFLVLLPVATGLIFWYGYLDHYPYLKYSRSFLQSINDLKLSSSSFSVYGPTSAMITYNRCNIPYNLYVPYHSRLVSKMSPYRVFLVKDGNEVDITQQPGIPYMLTAESMGGTELIVRKSGEVVTRYEKNVVPGNLS